MDSNSSQEAIEILINNFTCHPRLSHLTTDSKMNVFDVLDEFWQMKQLEDQTLNQKSLLVQPKDNRITYEFLERPGHPHICLCTLPGGACFATFQNCLTKSDAKKSSALLALMNSMFNEHPLRKINHDFIKKSIENAQKDLPNACSLSLELYKSLLEMCLNKTLLEFKQMMTVFQLLHWNGSLKAMRERNCSLDDVLNFYKNFKIDENMRSEMSLDWIAREQQRPGLIAAELEKVGNEIETARLNGHEMRFLKEKRDILLLASYQFDTELMI
ncbi:LIX1 [Brachionus plicatilis]|nr:LIX1 [Brachionus plicatilis]